VFSQQIPRDYSQIKLSDSRQLLTWRRKLVRGFTTTTDLLHGLQWVQSADDVVGVAQKYGPLWLCKHGWSYWHRDNLERAGLAPIESLPEPKKCLPMLFDPDKDEITHTQVSPDHSRVYAEPVNAWLELAEQVRQFADLVGNIRRTTLSEEKIQGLKIYGWDDPTDAHMSTTLNAVSGMIQAGHGSFPFRTLQSTGDVVLEPERDGVISAVGWQMLASLMEPEGFANCDICQRLYQRNKRSPKRGQLNYCSAGCRTAGATNRQRKRREKQTKS
jgi:hypothetical protein